MRAKVVVRQQGQPVRRIVIPQGAVFEIGRGRAVDIQLKGQGISRQHASLALREDGLYVRDLGSRNGTIVGGTVVNGGEEKALEAHAEFVVGPYTLSATIHKDSADNAAVTDMARVQALVGPKGIDIRYQIGRGGTGTVWAGWQTTLKRMLAVKVLDVYDPEDRKRFIREARVAARIDSPFVVKLYDFRIEKGRPYLLMELVPGLSALERLAEGPISIEECLRIAEDMARALASLEESGVVHRDVKPGNVLLGPDGVAKLSDFGIARDLNSETILTQAGTGLGTFSYMAPEQFQEARTADFSADIYGLGATLYHLIANEPPFIYTGRGNPAEFVEQIIGEDPPDLVANRSDCPRDVADLVHSMLRKDPRARPRSATVAFNALRELRSKHYPDPRQGDVSDSSDDTLPGIQY